MKGSGKKIAHLLVSFLIIALILLTSTCEKADTEHSFISSLDRVDALMKQKLWKEATEQLSKIEKKARSLWSYIGIFRRYKAMGEEEKAESVLKNAIKHNPHSLELKAVYAHFLLKRGQEAEALTVAEVLQDSQYSNIYAECLLKNAIKSANRKEGELWKYWLSKENLPLFISAYSATGDSLYLRNAALVYLLEGKYKKAGELVPEAITEGEDAYFWGEVLFDLKEFAAAIEMLDTAYSLLKEGSNSSNYLHNKARILNLEADCYTALKEEGAAQKLRAAFINSLEMQDGDYILPYGKTDIDSDIVMFSSLFTNAARYALDNEDYDRCDKYIRFAVTQWPDNFSTLSLYTDYVIKLNTKRQEDFIEQKIKEAGGVTLSMEEYNKRPNIPLTDPQYRIEKSLEKTGDTYLYLLSLNLKYQVEKGITIEEKTSDLWDILERNIDNNGVYPAPLFIYTVNFLLSNKKTEDAWQLFVANLTKKYALTRENKKEEKATEEALRLDYLTIFYNNLSLLSKDEAEYAAYFSLIFLYKDLSLSFYKSLVASSSPSISSIINLSLIYSSIGREEDALKLYEKAFGLLVNLKLKSEVMYRIASIYLGKGEVKEAKRAAEYAVTLYEKNAAARLLLSRIAIKE